MKKRKFFSANENQANALQISTPHQFSANHQGGYYNFFETEEQRRARGFVVNAALRHDQHLAYDQALINEAQRHLRLVEDFRSAGMTHQLSGLGVLLSYMERMDSMSGADITIHGNAMPDNDTISFDQIGVPIPIISKGFQLSKRHLASATSNGTQLDQDHIRAATRAVAEKMELTVLYGDTGIKLNGQSLVGILNHPNRNTAGISDWNGGTPTIIDDVLGLLQIMYDDNRKGPFVLYVNKTYATKLQEDFSATKGDKTYKQRIMDIDDIADVRISSSLSNNEVVLIEMAKSAIDIAWAQDLKNVQWNDNAFFYNFMVFTAMAVRVKPDRNGSCGIVHGTVTI